MDHSNMHVVHLREVTDEEPPIFDAAQGGEYEEQLC
jgi:hypothetical protein